jgi:hypothetical protein
MNQEDQHFVDEAVRDLARAVEEGLEEHPDPDTLLAHHRGELSPEEAAAVDDHVLWCRDCASFSRHTPVPEEELGPVDSDEAAADWRALRRRIEAESTSEQDTTSARRQVPAARAAVAAIALVAAGVWIGHVLSDGESPPAPEPNVQIVDLAPPASDRATDAPATEFGSETYTVLVLSARLPEDAARFEARFVDTSGRTAYTVRDLVPAEYGNLHIGLPPGALAAGEYRVELVEPDTPEPLETFPVRVLEPAR